jgi:hypothetical protein
MESDKESDAVVTMAVHPAERIFRRELELIDDDEEKIKKILGRFELYSHDIHDIKDLNPDETDVVLLWLTNMLRDTFLKNGRNNSNSFWELNVCLRNVYNMLPIQYESKYLFPETKKSMLRTILDQWNVAQCDERGQEIFMFIWDIYIDERPLDERKSIDALMMERLDWTNFEDVEEWIKWIATVKSQNNNKYLSYKLGKLFAIARARYAGFEGAWWDVRRKEIVDSLCIRDVKDDMLHALFCACRSVLNLNKEIIKFLDQLSAFLKLSKGERISHEFLWDNHVKISIFLDNRSRIIMNNDWEKLLVDIVDNIENKGLISKAGDNLCFSGFGEIFADLFLFDENGDKRAEKHWIREKGELPF